MIHAKAKNVYTIQIIAQKDLGFRNAGPITNILLKKQNV